MESRIVLIGVEHLQWLAKKLEKTYQDFLLDRDIEKLNNELQGMAKKYCNVKYASDFFVKYGAELLEAGEPACGMAYLLAIESYLQEEYDDTADTVTLYLRLAEHYLENNETEKGINYLIKLCTETTSNYEESIEFRELTDVWEKYKHLVAGKVPESVNKNGGVSPVAPEKCSMKIADILTLPQEELLTQISTHLNEMSGNGAYLNYLNKWEKLVFDSDLVLTEVNSDGFSATYITTETDFPMQ